MQSLLWTMPLLLFASIIIGWAAEIAAVYISAGIALAILAWLQTAPEFAIEAVIAWHRDENLVLANLTGSLRLLMGLGWPMIFFIHQISSMMRKKSEKTPWIKNVQLPLSFSVEAFGLMFSVLYFLIVYHSGTWDLVDGIILVLLYGFYFWLLNRERKFGIKQPDEEEEDAGGVVHKILKKSPGVQKFWGFAFFIVGGTILIMTAHPFVDALKAAASTLGVSEFVFIQWIAPLASEFPEKVTAFQWATHPKKVPMAIVNMLSSIICQWTLFAGMVPIIFSISAGKPSAIHFSEFQNTELMLTIAQSAVAVLLLADLKIEFYEALGLFLLWFIQFVAPSTRHALINVYWIWFAFEFFNLIKKPSKAVAWKTVWYLIRGKKPHAS